MVVLGVLTSYLLPGNGAADSVARAPFVDVLIDDLADPTPIHPALFGVHVGAVGQGAFSPFSPFGEKNGLSRRGIRSVRSYGCGADIHHWRIMVGPVEERARFAHSNPCFANDVRRLYDAAPVFPLNLEWGVDEIFDFAIRGGAEMVATVNFGTGSAQEAANFVEYANSPSPDPNCDGADGSMATGWTPDAYAGDQKAPRGYFACLRHFFGREEPYGVQLWEVGNEIAGESSPTWTADTRLYYQGGTAVIDPGYVTRDPQRLDWSGNQRQTTCTAGQRFHVMFPPIDASSGKRLRLRLVESRRECGIGGSREVCRWTAGQRAVSNWREVESLDGAGPNDRVFEVDHARGTIRFGDGAHGRVPECASESDRGHEVVIGSYRSGPHGGFVDFEAAMKAVDPKIRVGSGHPYPPKDAELRARLDFIAMHPYMAAFGPDTQQQQGMNRAPRLEDFRPALMSWTHRMIEPEIARYRSLFGRDVQLAWTEWNLAHAFSGKPPTPEYTTSLDVGLFTADMLRAAIVNRVIVSNFFGLGFLERGKGMDREQGHGLVTWDAWTQRGGERRLSMILQPPGLVFQMFGDAFGTEALSTKVTGSPEFSACWPTCTRGWGVGDHHAVGPRDYPTLEALGSRHRDGRIALLVINKDLNRTLTIAPRMASAARREGRTIWTWLTSRDAALHPGRVTNSRQEPNAVMLKTRELDWSSTITLDIPPQSVNMIEIPTTAEGRAGP